MRIPEFSECPACGGNINAGTCMDCGRGRGTRCMICHAPLWTGSGDPEEGYCLGSRTHMDPPDAGDIAEAHRDYPETARGAWGERFEYEGDRYDPSDESLPESEFI